MQKITRVLFLSNMGPSVSMPNSGRFVMNQYKSLKAQPDLLLDYYYLTQEKTALFARLFRYPVFFMRFLMRYVFSAQKQHIIHVHFYFPNILLAIAYKFFRNWQVKIVVTFHGSDIYLYTPPSYLYKMCTRFVDKYIFVSEKLKKRFFKPVESVVLSAGVNDVFYQQQGHTKCIKNKYDFVFVGHLDINKGIERLEEILVSFPCQVRVAIVGAGECDFIERIKVNERVSITYFDSLTPTELVTIYNESQLLINLSYNESFGLVMSEAMACGTPVLATKTDGACAQITNGVNGFLIENDDGNVCTNTTRAIQHVMNLPKSDYKNMSEQAVKTAEQYRLSSVANEITKIYKELRLSKVND
jgi:glycosyltransferase involved in cell wall biosynthesis